MRTLEEVTELLAKRYDGPTSTRQGRGNQQFTYIPWTDTVRLLNEVFGPFGWTTSAPHSYYANGTYTTEFGLTVRVLDGKSVVEKTVPAQGQASVTNSDGSVRIGDDNAAKSAQSDALSRGAKLLGDAFGFFLYEEKQAQPAQATSRPAVVGTVTGPATKDKYPPSEKQLAFLHALGYSDAAIAQMTYREWRPILENKTKAPATVAAAPDGDIPF